MAEPWGLRTSPDLMCQHLDMEDAVLLLWSMRLEEELFQSFAAHLWGATSSLQCFQTHT